MGALRERHGTISLEEALVPAIALAEEGFPVTDVTAAECAVFANLPKEDAGASATFLVNVTRSPPGHTGG